MGRFLDGRYEFTEPWEARFWAKVQPGESPFHCWLWQARTERGGYGRFEYDKTKHRAHRVAYRLVFGKLPAELVLDHLCSTPRCVSPFHLEAVTSSENSRRGAARRRGIAVGRGENADQAIVRHFERRQTGGEKE